MEPRALRAKKPDGRIGNAGYVGQHSGRILESVRGLALAAFPKLLTRRAKAPA
jgi:hypothetical protein